MGPGTSRVLEYPGTVPDTRERTAPCKLHRSIPGSGRAPHAVARGGYSRTRVLNKCRRALQVPARAVSVTSAAQAQACSRICRPAAIAITIALATSRPRHRAHRGVSWPWRWCCRRYCCSATSVTCKVFLSWCTRQAVPGTDFPTPECHVTVPVGRRCVCAAEIVQNNKLTLSRPMTAGARRFSRHVAVVVS